jgi:preprotein translocase subunit YajC
MMTTIMMINLLAQDTPAQNQPSILDMLIPMGLLFAMMYFLIIRPQQKKVKEHKALVSSIKTGDKVVAAGGIYGVITSVKDKSVGLKISDQVKIEVDRASITTVERSKDEEKKED